jgi:hypothetical protein
MTPELLDQIDRLVPARDIATDWNDVLARAGVTRGPRRRAVTFGLVLVAVILVAAPAYALVAHLLGRSVVTFSSAPAAPNLIKKQFYDLDSGAPRGFTTGVEPGKARRVATARFGGKEHTLWVAPTAKGGYCFEWSGSWGGCTRGQDRNRPFAAGFSERDKPGTAPQITAVMGNVNSADVKQLVVEYADGSRSDVPFFWVTAPISAGFFTFPIPRGTHPLRVVELNGTGHRIAAWSVPHPHRMPVVPASLLSHPSPRTALPTTGPAPTAPVQHGSERGVTVAVGANDAAVFDLSHLDSRLKKILSPNTSYGCFKLTRVFGIQDSEGDSYEGPLQSKVVETIGHVKPPFDGCEVSSDALGWHAPVEIPLTSKGAAFFADRATARDLAGLVRSAEMQKLRREPPAQALRDIQRVYGRALAEDTIRIVRDGDGLRYSKGRFVVVIQRVDGRMKITHQNLKPYAFVF